jgi:hypothetical protein
MWAILSISTSAILLPRLPHAAEAPTTASPMASVLMQVQTTYWQTKVAVILHGPLHATNIAQVRIYHLLQNTHPPHSLLFLNDSKILQKRGSEIICSPAQTLKLALRFHTAVGQMTPAATPRLAFFPSR